MPAKATAGETVVPPADNPPASTEATSDKPAETSSKVVLGSDELFTGIPGTGKLEMVDAAIWLADPKNNEVFEFDLPLGMSAGKSQVKGVDTNPLTRARSSWAGSCISIPGCRPTER